MDTDLKIKNNKNIRKTIVLRSVICMNSFLHNMGTSNRDVTMENE